MYDFKSVKLENKMLIESKGYTFLSLIHAINTDRTIIHPYIITRGKDKGYFQYSINGSNNFERATLVELIDMLLNGEFNGISRIRMRYIDEPQKYQNNALVPIFNKSELIAFRKTL